MGDVAQLCKDSDISYDNNLSRYQGALHAEAADAVEYIRILDADGQPQSAQVDVHVIPTGEGGLPPKPPAINAHAEKVDLQHHV